MSRLISIKTRAAVQGLTNRVSAVRSARACPSRAAELRAAVRKQDLQDLQDFRDYVEIDNVNFGLRRDTL